MPYFILQANIAHYKERLVQETDSKTIVTLHKLLAEEEDKLVAFKAKNPKLPKVAASLSSRLNELARQDAFWSEFEYSCGSKLFGQAEPANYVYRIREGAVRTYTQLSDGRRQIGAFLLRGDIFGVEDGEVHRFTAEAIVDTTVWIAKRRSLFAKLTKGDISAANTIRDLVTRALEHAENHLLLLGRQNSLEKVAAFLLEIDRRLGQPDVMVLPMTRCDIADYLGTTLETVSRSLSVLRDERVLSFRGASHREIVLHDRPKLAQRATSVWTRAESQ
jgi:CRP/FNR family nitrogen fixation transcriptional regulator